MYILSSRCCSKRSKVNISSIMPLVCKDRRKKINVLDEATGVWLIDYINNTYWIWSATNCSYLRCLSSISGLEVY